jgi:hypothetical protein
MAPPKIVHHLVAEGNDIFAGLVMVKADAYGRQTHSRRRETGYPCWRGSHEHMAGKCIQEDANQAALPERNLQALSQSSITSSGKH